MSKISPARFATVAKATRTLRRNVACCPTSAPRKAAISGLLARQPRRDDPVGLETEPEPLAILRGERVEPGEVADPLEPVAHGVAVRVDRRGGGVHVAVLGEIGLERGHEVARVLLVV